MRLLPMIITATITIIIVAAVIPFFESDPENLGDWQYDDYRLVPDVASASGALEIIEMSEGTYVHAVDVGEGIITYSNGASTTVNVERARLDLIFALGQSNNTYLNADLDAVSEVPALGTSYYFGTSDAPATGKGFTGASFQSLFDESGALKVGDKLPTFCKNYTEITHHKVYYVIGASAGSSITDWVPGQTVWNNAKTVLTLALSSVDASKFDISTGAYTWIQGESSRYVTQEEYIADFLQLDNSLQTGKMGAKFNNVFISLPMKYANPILAQQKMGQEYSNVHVVTDIASTFTQDNGLLGPDGLHYSQSGYNIIGSELGQACGNWEKNQGVGPAYEGILHAIPAIILISIVIMFAGFITIRKSSA